jgi:hypothetical protein
MEGREPPKSKEGRPEVVEARPVNGPAFGVRSWIPHHATRRRNGPPSAGR